MSTDDESLDDAPPQPWVAALARFADAYGGEPDYEDRTDRYLIVQLLEEAVHEKVTRELVTMFRRATERIEAQTRALEQRL